MKNSILFAIASILASCMVFSGCQDIESSPRSIDPQVELLGNQMELRLPNPETGELETHYLDTRQTPVIQHETRNGMPFSTSGRFTVTNFLGDETIVTFSLTENDGGINGQITGRGGRNFNADATCVNRDGNRVTIGGIFKPYENGTEQPGWGIIFMVEDNGEGAAAPPDQSSSFFITFVSFSGPVSPDVCLLNGLEPSGLIWTIIGEQDLPPSEFVKINN